MARFTLTVDSATPEQVYSLTLAYQRTLRDFSVGPQWGEPDPHVKVMGVAMTWKSPALSPEHARAVMDEYDSIVGPDDKPLSQWEKELLTTD